MTAAPEAGPLSFCGIVAADNLLDGDVLVVSVSHQTTNRPSIERLLWGEIGRRIAATITRSHQKIEENLKIPKRPPVTREAEEDWG